MKLTEKVLVAYSILALLLVVDVFVLLPTISHKETVKELVFVSRNYLNKSDAAKIGEEVLCSFKLLNWNINYSMSVVHPYYLFVSGTPSPDPVSRVEYWEVQIIKTFQIVVYDYWIIFVATVLNATILLALLMLYSKDR